MPKKEYSVQETLELSCAVFRVNGCYQKETEAIYSADGKVMAWKHSNKNLMLYATGEHNWQGSSPLPVIEITSEDTALAEEIKSFFRRLAFAVLANPENSFQQDLIVLLNSESVPAKKFGYFACLPSTYLRDKNKLSVERKVKFCKETVLGAVGEKLTDKDCEILEVKESKNYPGMFNVLAIIDECLVTWMSKQSLILGPCVVQSAKIKNHGHHWLYKKIETMLNYVRAFQ